MIFVKRNERVTESTTSFWSLLNLVKVKTLIVNFSFLISIFITVAFYLVMSRKSDLLNTVNYFSNTIASISATLMGIVIAGLAILIALVQGKVLGLLLQKSVLQKFLFPFWFLSGTWALSTLLSTSSLFFYDPIGDYIVYYLSFNFFAFTYSLFGTISLMGHAIRLGLFLATLPTTDNSEK